MGAWVFCQFADRELSLLSKQIILFFPWKDAVEAYSVPSSNRHLRYQPTWAWSFILYCMLSLSFSCFRLLDSVQHSFIITFSLWSKPVTAWFYAFLGKLRFTIDVQEDFFCLIFCMLPGGRERECPGLSLIHLQQTLTWRTVHRTNYHLGLY